MCVCGSDWHGCKGGERPDYSPWWPGQVHEVCGEKKLLRHRDLKKMLACPPFGNVLTQSGKVTHTAHHINLHLSATVGKVSQSQFTYTKILKILYDWHIFIYVSCTSNSGGSRVTIPWFDDSMRMWLTQCNLQNTQLTVTYGIKCRI